MDIEKFSFFENSALLLALIVAFYGLIAQWRKTPYMVNSMFILTRYCLYLLIFSILIASLVLTIHHIGLVSWRDVDKDLFFDTLNISVPLIICLITIYFLNKDYRKYFLLRTDTPSQKDTSGDHLMDKSQTSNQANPEFIKKTMKDFFLMTEYSDWSFLKNIKKNNYSITTFCQIESNERFNYDIYRIALRFLETGAFVQYTSCDRHPIEFLNGLKECYSQDENSRVPSNIEKPLPNITSNEEYLDKKWQTNYKNKLVLIDAHTNHFGFSETIYNRMRIKAQKDCLEVFVTDTSYPGIHSAIVKGFKLVSSKNPASANNLGLVIYENISSLIDIESPEQYRIFMRHVAASERLLGGMFTVFYENNISSENASFAKSIVDKSFTFRMDRDIAYSEKEIQDAIISVMDKVIVWMKEQINKNRKIIILTIYNGGKVFSDDLLKNILQYEESLKTHITVEKTHHRSYYMNGNKRNVTDSDIEIPYISKDDAILVVDDICHTGDTLGKVHKKIYDFRGHRDNIKTIVAIKRSTDNALPFPDWYLFDYHKKHTEYPDAWLYGYGMDDNLDENSRKLPYFVFSRRYGS